MVMSWLITRSATAVTIESMLSKRWSNISSCFVMCWMFNACGFPSCTYPRSGWCPGEIACHYNLDAGCDQDLDATAWLPPGGTYSIGYEILERHGSWAKSITVFWYE